MRRHLCPSGTRGRWWAASKRYSFFSSTITVRKLTASALCWRRLTVSVIAEFRALDRRNWYLAGARLVVTAGFSMVLPFLPMYLTGTRGEKAIVAGEIWTLAGVVGAAMQWVAGTLSDRIGRRDVMAVSMVLRALNLAGLGYAIATRAPILLLGTLIVTNAALRAFFDPLANAL